MSFSEADAQAVGTLLSQTREIARHYFYGRPAELDTADKGGAAGYDPVTAADRRIEELLRAGIEERWPGDRIVGEEEGESGHAAAARSWYIDPIDGTKAFVTGMAGWGTLLGLVADGHAIAGWMDQPILGETFSAIGGAGRYLRRTESGVQEERELRTSGCTQLGDAVLYTTHPSMFAGQQAAGYARLAEAVRLQRFGGDCYAYCQLAAGRVDLVVESQLNAHDIIALIPIIEAAGGVVWGPQQEQPLRGGTVVAAASAELAEQAWALLREGE